MSHFILSFQTISNFEESDIDMKQRMTTMEEQYEKQKMQTAEQEEDNQRLQQVFIHQSLIQKYVHT